MAEQYLDGSQVARCLVNHRSLGSPHRVCPVLLPAQSDGCNPLINQLSILPSAQMSVAIYPAWEGIVINSAATTLEPCHQASSYVASQFELNRPVRLWLDDSRASPDLTAGNQVADLEFYQVTAAQLAVDGEVEQRSVSDSLLAIEKETNSSYLLL